MPIALDAVMGAIKPVADLIDNVTTSGEERGKLRLAFGELQGTILGQVLDYESTLVRAQAEIVKAEAQGKSAIQRTWRPILALGFGFIVLWNYAGVILLEWILVVAGAGVAPPPRLEMPGGLWALLTTMIGGYVVGRSGEKIATALGSKVLDFSKGAGGGMTRKERRRHKRQRKAAARGVDTGDAAA